MTLAPAEIFGVSDRMGSVEAGKIANLTVVKGDLFANQRTITHVFVDGKLFEPKAPEPPAGRGPGGRGPQRTDGAASESNGGPANVGGTYSISIQTPDGGVTGTLNIVQTGSTLTGTMTTDLGSVPLRDGRVTANGMSFAGTVSVGGQSIDFTVQAAVSGNQLSGSVTSAMGSMPMTGTKNP